MTFQAVLGNYSLRLSWIQTDTWLLHDILNAYVMFSKITELLYQKFDLFILKVLISYSLRMFSFLFFLMCEFQVADRTTCLFKCCLLSPPIFLLVFTTRAILFVQLGVLLLTLYLILWFRFEITEKPTWHCPYSHVENLTGPSGSSCKQDCSLYRQDLKE